MTKKWLDKESSELIALARRLRPEGEGLDVTDREYTKQDMAELRSHLSSMRSAIDIVNKAFAEAWEADFKGEVYDDGVNTWSVGRTKGKVIIDKDQFYRWLATKDAEQLVKLISAGAVKVGGMSVVERETLIDETPVNDRLSLKGNINR